jgi:hypothetical protein
MGKGGHSSGKGIMYDDNVTAERIINDMKGQAAQLKNEGYLAKLDLATEKRKGRPYVLITVMDAVVKKYLTKADLKHYPEHTIKYENAFTEKDKKKLGKDFKMPNIED